MIDMDRVAERVVEAGFAAYVEQTGGGCATIFASREWQDVPVSYVGKPSGTIRLPATHGPADDPVHDVAAGPGWFEGPNFSQARGDGADFAVSPDGIDYDPRTTIEVSTEDEAVAAILTLLRK